MRTHKSDSSFKTRALDRCLPTKSCWIQCNVRWVMPMTQYCYSKFSNGLLIKSLSSQRSPKTIRRTRLVSPTSRKNRWKSNCLTMWPVWIIIWRMSRFLSCSTKTSCLSFWKKTHTASIWISTLMTRSSSTNLITNSLTCLGLECSHGNNSWELDTYRMHLRAHSRNRLSSRTKLSENF